MECLEAMAWAPPCTATGRASAATMASQAAMASRWTGALILIKKCSLNIACSRNFTVMLWRPYSQTILGMAAAPAETQMVCIWRKECLGAPACCSTVHTEDAPRLYRTGNWRQDDGSNGENFVMNIAQIQAMAADLGARTLGQVGSPLAFWHALSEMPELWEQEPARGLCLST